MYGRLLLANPLVVTGAHEIAITGFVVAHVDTPKQHANLWS